MMLSHTRPVRRGNAFEGGSPFRRNVSDCKATAIRIPLDGLGESREGPLEDVRKLASPADLHHGYRTSRHKYCGQPETEYR